MAILLADVIENVERQVPVIDPRTRTIHGLYLGSSTGSVVQLEPQYSSAVFQGVKTASNGHVAFSSSAGSVAQIDGANPLLLTDRGGILTAYDDVSSRLHAYMLKSVVNGDDATTAANRSSADKFQELVSQFDVYSEIAAGDIQEAINDGDEVWFAAYDTGDKRQYKVSAANLVNVLASVLAQDAINNGLLTVNSAGGTGTIGDLNGDGVVGSADLLLLLGMYNDTGTTSFETELIYLTGSTVSAVTTLSEQPLTAGSGTGNAYVLADFDTWSFGASVTSDTDQLFGWSSATAPGLNNTGNFSLNTCSINTPGLTPNLTIWSSKKFQVEVEIALQPNYVYEAVQIYLYVEVEFENGTTKEQLYDIGRIGFGLPNSISFPNDIGSYSFVTCSFDSSMINKATNNTNNTNDAGVSKVFEDELGNGWQGGDTTAYANQSQLNVGMDQPWNLAWNENPGGNANYIDNITFRVLASSYLDYGCLWYIDTLIVRTTSAEMI
jgi:hypothetical protein